MQQSTEGQARLKRQADRENDHLARLLEQQDREEEQAKKKARMNPTAKAEEGTPNEAPGARTSSAQAHPWLSTSGGDAEGELGRASLPGRLHMAF